MNIIAPVELKYEAPSEIRTHFMATIEHLSHYAARALPDSGMVTVYYYKMNKGFGLKFPEGYYDRKLKGIVTET